MTSRQISSTKQNDIALHSPQVGTADTFPFLAFSLSCVFISPLCFVFSHGVFSASTSVIYPRGISFAVPHPIRIVSYRLGRLAPPQHACRTQNTMRFSNATLLLLAPLLFSLVAARPAPQPSAAELHLREMEDDGSVAQRGWLRAVSESITR